VESTAHPRWRPGLDGLRALAVLGVMAYHEPNITLDGGFLGVDLFFVLSGFLITGLLLDEHRNQLSISLRGFWTRRARRLLPALALLLIGVVTATAIIGDVSQKNSLAGTVAAAITYVSNWELIHQGSSYFDHYTALSPLQHLWSLAIEEQFYVLWPLVVAFCLRHNRRLLVIVASAGAILSVFSMAILSLDGDLSRAYYGTDSRISALLIGALGAMFAWNRISTSRRSTAIGILAFFLLMAAYGFVGDDQRWMYRGGFALFAVVALTVVIAASGRNILATALSQPLLRRIGAISYALYLWHWPVRVYVTDGRLPFANNTLGNIEAIVLRFSITLALAIASTLLFEKAVRRSKIGLPVLGSSWLAVGALTVAAALLIAPGSGSATNLVAGPTDLARRTQLLNDQPAVDAAARRILIIGDSVAITATYSMNTLLPPNIKVIGGAELGCALLTSPKVRKPDGTVESIGNLCPDHDLFWASLVEAQKPDVILFLTGAWDVYARDWGNGFERPGDSDFDRRYRDALTTSLDVLAATNAEVIVLTTPCFTPLGGQEKTVEYEESTSASLVAIQKSVVTSRSATDENLTILDLHSITCENGFTWTRDGVEWRPDGVHFSKDGSALVSQWILENLPIDARLRLSI